MPSSPGSVQPLDLRPRRSRRLAGAVLLSHAAALVVLAGSAGLMPPWLRLGLVAAVVLSLLRKVRTHVLRRGPGAIVELRWDGADTWQLIDAAGGRRSVQLVPDTFVHPQLVVLNFRQSGRWRGPSVVLFPDALDVDTFRRLRVRLRLGASNRFSVSARRTPAA